MAWGGADTARVLAPPPLLFLGAMLAGGLADRALGLRPLGAPRGRRQLGAALFLAGLGLEVWAALEVKRAGSAVVPNQPTTAIVRFGPYGRTRNPIYLGMALTYAGVALWRGATAPFLLLGPLLALVNDKVVAREEAYLERRFGDDYRRYRDSTPRWF